MGSRTFHDMAAYWPTSTHLLAPLMNEIPKVVFSRKGSVDLSNTDQRTQGIKDKTRLDREQGILPSPTLSPAAATWAGARVAVGGIEIEIAKLKAEKGGPLIAHGGASFARSLVRSGLIDEYRLLVHPVVLGRGLPLFTELKTRVYLNLESSTPFRTGALANVYRPIRD